MNGKTVLAAILGTVTHFLLGFLIYGMLLMDFMTANSMVYEGLVVEGAAAMPGYILSSLFFATLITFILRKARIDSARQGAITAALASALMAGSIDFMFYFTMNLFNAAAMVADILAFTVMGSLVGLVVGWVLKRSPQRAASGASVA